MSFVDVPLNGWEPHGNTFAAHKDLNTRIDKPWAALLADLYERGLLDNTMVIWMSEFGRTPKINSGKGRDHWTKGWSIGLAGGGFKNGGYLHGSTDKKGVVNKDPVSVKDFYCTVAHLMGIDPQTEYYTKTGRPITAVDMNAKIVPDLLA